MSKIARTKADVARRDAKQRTRRRITGARLRRSFWRWLFRSINEVRSEYRASRGQSRGPALSATTKRQGSKRRSAGGGGGLGSGTPRDASWETFQGSRPDLFAEGDSRRMKEDQGRRDGAWAADLEPERDGQQEGQDSAETNSWTDLGDDQGDDQTGPDGGEAA